MKGWRFYEELENKNRKAERSRGTVIAIALEDDGTPMGHFDDKKYVYEGFGAVQDYPDCPVAGTSVAHEYLREECRRIPESRAREIHPQLFMRLDADD